MTATQPSSSSARFVDRLAGAVGNRFNRRGFFTRTAVVGAALAVSPTDYVLKPGTAYAAICSCNNYSCDCGSMCCDGYTEFCCTLSGQNQCPPGTRLGGWWKADGTGLCGPNAPRYYMDCNVDCGGCGCGGNGVCSGSCTGTPCGCMNGDCNNRKSGCVHFRYGQCNNQYACLGPILCRVVTCIPPWQIDGSCTTTTLVDQNTAFHDRPCLHRTVGSVDSVTDVGGALRIQGWALDYDTSASINVQVFIDGSFVAQDLADSARSDIATNFPGMGPYHGYDVVVPANVGSHRVDVYGIGVGPNPTNVLIGSVSAKVTSPFGSIDLVSGGYNQLRVTGWAIDPDTTGPTPVHVYVDGVGAAILSANLNRPDLGALYPAWGPNHGFDATIPMAPGTHTVDLYAINSAGPPAGNTLLGSRTVTVLNGNPFGYLDVVSTLPTAIRVRGWTIDPDTTAPVTVQVVVDGAVAATVPADGARADVGAVYPTFGPNHGYDVTVPASTGTHAVSVVAVNVGNGSTNTVLGTRTVTVGGIPGGSLDQALMVPGGVRVLGWALDPDTVDPIAVHIWVDGAPAAATTANTGRPDVGAAFPGYGDNHGFDVTVPLTAGKHTINAYAINVGSGASNAFIGGRGVTAGGNPFGYFDEAVGGTGTVQVRGWAIDPDTGGPITVHIWADGSPLAAVTTDVSRPDIALAYPGWGDVHGFDDALALPAGTHVLQAYAINTGSGTANVFLGTKTVTVA